MSLLSAIILPKLEKELIALRPEIVQFILTQLQFIGNELLAWAESKMHLATKSPDEDIPQ